MWANNFDKCITCGKDEFPHISKGLCKRCWDIHLNIKNKKENLENNKPIHIWRKKRAVPIQGTLNKSKEYNLSPQNKTKLIAQKWAHDFDKCVSCGKDDIPHASKGLCDRCYGKYQYRRINPHMYLPAKDKTIILSEEYLFQEYIKNKKSLSDIAKEYGCTRQFIYKKMKEYGIPSYSD